MSEGLFVCWSEGWRKIAMVDAGHPSGGPKLDPETKGRYIETSDMPSASEDAY